MIDLRIMFYPILFCSSKVNCPQWTIFKEDS